MGVTNVQLSDQILMCNGAPLDPAKDLAAYALPVSPTVLSLSTLAPPLCESECWVAPLAGHGCQWHKRRLPVQQEPSAVTWGASSGGNCQAPSC